MPPQAEDGFRYTPAAYLQRTRDENRPWTNGDAEDDLGGWKQEDRPSRKQTSINSNFQSRVNRRKEAYRSILKGDDASPSPVSMESGPFLSSVTSSNTENSDMFVSDAKAAAAREARQKRLQGQATHAGHPLKAEASQVRVLRARRLRNSLKQSTDEEDAMEALRKRRQEQMEKERNQRLEEEALKKKEKEELRRLDEERRQLEKEQEELEMAKRRAQAVADQRRPPSPTSSEEEQKPKRKLRRRKKEPTSEETEPTLLEEIHTMVSETGVFKSCVSCFGNEDDLDLLSAFSQTDALNTSLEVEEDDELRMDEF